LDIERFERQFNLLNDEALAKSFHSRAELCPEAQAALMAVAYSRGLTPEKLETLYSSQPTQQEVITNTSKKLVRKAAIFLLFSPYY